MESKNSKKMIGRREWASLPDLGLKQVIVKIDTGAYSSSIHASYIQEQDGILDVIFLDEKHPEFHNNILSFKAFRKKNVRSSNGHVQERYFIKTKIVIGNEEFKTEFSLTKRNGLRYPILIGRRLLNKRFIIDTSLKYTQSKV
jgi:hypothetical protein